MKREPSLIRPLVLAIVSVLVLFWLLAIGLSVQTMREEFDEIFDSELTETAQILLTLAVERISHLNGGDHLDGLLASNGREYLTYQLRDAEGRVMLRSADAPEEPFAVPLKAGFYDASQIRLYTAATPDGRFFLHVADRFANRREAVRETALVLLIPLLILIPASMVAVRLIVRRALRPVDLLRQQIATKDGGNMAPIDQTGLQKELRPIARSVNLLLDRLRSALDAEREFTATSAHELRTPIAGALAQTQRLIDELPDGSTKRRARQIESSLVRFGRLAEKLLQLSRAEAGIGTSETLADLRRVLDIVVHDYRVDSRAANRLQYHVAPGATLLRNVDVDAFGIVMRNLIENALLHGDPDHPVNISLERDGVIRIENDSAPLDRDELEALKGRFRRGKTQSVGSGLGLAIAERIAVQMGGRMELISPATGRQSGFEVRLILPERATG